METVKRFSISLLISTVLFAGFAFFAFSGFFPWLEAQFYSPKIVSDLQLKLSQDRAEIQNWKKSVEDRFMALNDEGSLDGVFAPAQNRENLQKRYQTVKLFLQGFRGNASLRILDPSREQIHFSTVDADVLASGDFSIAYKRYSVANPAAPLADPNLSDGKEHLFFDPLLNQLSILRPFTERGSKNSGFILMSISIDDLRGWLSDKGALAVNQPVYALGTDLLVISQTSKLDKPVLDRIRSLAANKILPPTQKLAEAEGAAPLVLMVSQGRDQNLGFSQLALVVPQNFLDLQDALKAIILVSFFTVVFLLSFLFVNLRGEPLSVVSRRVKRFQIQVVKEYLDLKEKEKIQNLRDELTRHTEQIKADIRHSLGKVKKGDKEWVDKYIDQSWQEILDLLGARPPEEQRKAESQDWQRLEKMLQEALSKGRFVVSGAPVSTPLQRPVEDVEEVEELEDLSDEVEELSEVDEIGEVEEVEEIEDAEEIADAEEVEELAEAEEVSDAEEVLDAEEVIELTEDEPIALDEEIPEVEVIPEDEEAEAEEELEELEGVEETWDASLEELPRQNGSTDIFSFSTPQADAPLGTLEALEDLDSEDGELEPLEEVAEEAKKMDDAEDAEEMEELAEPIPAIPFDKTQQVVTFSLDDLDQVWKKDEENVFDQEGEVVLISSDLFTSSEAATDEFGKLVETVIGPASPAFQGLEEEDVPAHSERQWKWTGGGFDWDRFVKQPGESETYKALAELTSLFDAFSAAVLVEEKGAWKAEISVGFSDDGKEKLVFGPSSDLYKQCLANRALHIVNGAPGSNRLLYKSFHPKDVKYLRCVILVPILTGKGLGWLLLGLKQYPERPLELVKPRVLS